MASHALDVRIAQLDISDCLLHLPRQSLRSAPEAAGRELLFASHEEGGSSYFATTLLGEQLPDPANEKMYLLPLHDQQPLSRAVSLKELHALGVHKMPFHINHFPIRNGSGGLAFNFGEYWSYTCWFWRRGNAKVRCDAH